MNPDTASREGTAAPAIELRPAPATPPTQPARHPAPTGDKAAPLADVADVAVPVPVRSTFAYRIPPAFRGRVHVGARVMVPFGARLLPGFVVGLDPKDAPAELKPLHSIVDKVPLADGWLLELTRWIAERTLCSWGEALKAALPGHSSPKLEKMVSLGASTAGDLFAGAEGISLDDRLLAAVGDSGEVPMRALAKTLGMRPAEVETEVRRLVRGKRLRLRQQVAAGPTAGVPKLKVVRLQEPAAPDEADLSRAPVQARCLEFLREAGGEMPLRDLAEAVAGSRGAVKRLVEKKWARVTMEAWEGREETTAVAVHRPVPNPAQADAIAALEGALCAGEHHTFLLHGVTGSGKTEVYLRAMEEARRLGRRSILLVPEITLTPQTVSRLRGRFGARAAVLHSRLTDSERRRTWHAAQQGRFDVVLGPRSAIFTPLPDLGLVIVDEEHEGAYKQEDAPRYHARDVAIERARQVGGVVVLGSATPDTESFQRTLSGEFTRLVMPDRVSNLPLPRVRLVDVRGTRGTFSPELLEAVRDRLEKKEQVILFLNRRGFSPFVQCSSCGEAVRCDQCAVSLTYHKTDGSMRCHYCDQSAPLPEKCPECQATTLVKRGLGTQRVEEELREHFPEMRLARLDSDSVRKSGAHEDILGRFLEGDIDVLLGTQMVAKGLDFPRVTLVGVINADTGLHLPDYRAAERTFQVLTQVSGRAGRSELGGEVLVQTRCPEHGCLLAARDHDDAAFRAEDLPLRKDLRYPPFSRLAGVLVRGENLPRVEAAADVIRDRIAETAEECGAWTVVLGPCPAPLAQLRGKHRFRLLIKGQRREDVRRAAERALEPLTGFPGVEVQVDVDPLDML